MVLPALTFRDAVTIHAGELCLEVFHVGPAHTTNDVVVWVPERRVLFAGDIVMSGVTPFCLMGSIQGSLRAVERCVGSVRGPSSRVMGRSVGRPCSR
ncbi:MAG: MBL fold metallo-hydrolase [Pseudonocardia sp.]